MRSFGVCLLVSLFVFASAASAATITVGTSGPPTYNYAKINDAFSHASNGDTITIDSGYYWHGNTGVDPGSPVSQSPVEPMAFVSKNLTIIGNPADPPVLDAGGFALKGEGLWIIQTGASNVVIQNIVFENARASANAGLNGAGIRVENCAGTLTLNNCEFRDCQNGILDTNGTPCNLVMQHCIIHDCGDPTSGTYGGVTHNLYLNNTTHALTNTLTFKYNWSYNCHSGYCLKTRYATNYIMYNRFGDEMGLALDQTPNTPAHQVGCPVDIPNGGLTYFIGNTVQDVPDSQDGRLVKYGEEGYMTGYSKQFYGVYNTLLGRRDATVTAFELTGNSAVPAYLANNFLVHDGAGNLVSGSIVNNSAMINSNLVLYEHQGMTPPAMQRYMYDANGYDCGDAPGAGNQGTANTFDAWNVLNVRPIDPNTFTNGAACSNTAAKMPLTGYQTLLGLALLPGSNPLALPATGADGTSLLATGQFAPMPYVAGMPGSETRLNGNDIGAYGPPGAINHQPVGTITSTLPQYIYEGWPTINLTAAATDQDAGQTLTYQWTQTTGQLQTLTGATSLNASFSVPGHSLTSRANEVLTFQFVATDNGSPIMSSTPVTTSVTCYLCGDIDHDNAVILADLKLLVAAWNTTPASPNWNKAADLDGDNAIILADLKLLVANWNRSL